MRTDNPIGPASSTHVSGTGYVLPGMKTYIVGGLMAALGAWMVRMHVPGDLQDWARANLPALLTILLGSGTMTLRAAIAKVHDLIKSRLGG